MALEALGRVRIVALDKTGTLTRGEPVVTDVIPVDGHAEATLLQLAASVECFSEHPLAQAIVRRAQNQGIDPLPAVDFSAQPGAGATARVLERVVTVGSPTSLAIEAPENKGLRPNVERLQSEGKTVVLVLEDDKLLGALAIQDQLRPEAESALRALRALGIRVAILTGDNRRTAEAMARSLGIDVVHAELKPEDKVRVVEDLRTREGDIAMVGDGINDAPALAAADVGIAMGTAGSDAAIEAADVALMSDDLRKVAYAVRLGRRARTLSRQNIAFSLLVLGALVPSAVLGLLGVAMAVVAHEASELLAVANGLRAALLAPPPSTSAR